MTGKRRSPGLQAAKQAGCCRRSACMCAGSLKTDSASMAGAPGGVLAASPRRCPCLRGHTRAPPRRRVGSGAPRRTGQHDVLLVHAGQLHRVDGQAVVRGGDRALQQRLRQRYRRRARQPHLRAPRGVARGPALGALANASQTVLHRGSCRVPAERACRVLMPAARATYHVQARRVKSECFGDPHYYIAGVLGQTLRTRTCTTNAHALGDMI